MRLRERARFGERGAPREGRHPEPRGRVGRAHLVLVLAAAHRAGVGVEGEAQLRRGFDRGAEGDLAPGRRDRVGARAAREVAEAGHVVRRHFAELVGDGDADRRPVGVCPDDVEAPALRGAQEGELGKAAADDEEPSHDGAPGRASGRGKASGAAPRETSPAARGSSKLWRSATL